MSINSNSEIVKSEFRSRIGDAKIEDEAKKISLVLSNEVYLEYEKYVHRF